MNAVAEQNVFIVNLDEIESKRKPTTPAPIEPGSYNMQDFISIPFPPGYTHLEVVSKDIRRCIKDIPLGEVSKKGGGFYLVLSIDCINHIYANPEQYRWVDGQPVPPNVDNPFEGEVIEVHEDK